jgi:[citrate (pro-3S)-lyase] ligase
LNAPFDLEVVDLDSKRELREISKFLSSFDLDYESDLDYTLALRLDGNLVATGSFKGEVLKNLAISPAHQGQGLTSAIVTALIREQARRGLVHYFVFTRPDKAHLFADLGFSEIASFKPQVALLETGLGSIADWGRDTASQVATLAPVRASVVINCNPFTKGHEALIRRAAGENEALIVFVVSEDRSVFPFADRFRLAQESLKDLTNTVILPSGKYMISVATFPTYFLKKDEGVLAQAGLDVTIFAEKIAPALNITSRYVGDEPICPVTRTYNQTLQKILPKHGLALKVMGRLTEKGQIISASLVRNAWKAKDWDTVSAMVPGPTLEYLRNRPALMDTEP